MTVVLSRDGLARTAKGHEIDPRQMSYREGDGFRSAARGRSTDQAIFIDSTGRSYSLTAGELPSARGTGEALTGRWTPPRGASFAHVVRGTGRRGDPARRNRWIRLRHDDRGSRDAPEGRQGELDPRREPRNADGPSARGREPRRAPITHLGYLLVIDASELARQPRGKGNRLIALPKSGRTAGDSILSVTLLDSDEETLRLETEDDPLVLEHGRLETVPRPDEPQGTTHCATLTTCRRTGPAGPNAEPPAEPPGPESAKTPAQENDERPRQGGTRTQGRETKSTPWSRRLNRRAGREIYVDNFAGAGGASNGIEDATSVPVDVAINHDGPAIAMHEANHPDTEHYQTNIWQVDPADVAARGTNRACVVLAGLHPPQPGQGRETHPRTPGAEPARPLRGSCCDGPGSRPR